MSPERSRDQSRKERARIPPRPGCYRPANGGAEPTTGGCRATRGAAGTRPGGEDRATPSTGRSHTEHGLGTVRRVHRARRRREPLRRTATSQARRRSAAPAAAGHRRRSRPGQRPAARPPASSYFGPDPSPSCPARSPPRRAGSPAASRGSCGRAPRRSTVRRCQAAIAISARMATITPKVERPNQAAPATVVRSHPHRSQNKTQPATTAAASDHRRHPIMKRRPASHRGDQRTPEETGRVACAGPCGVPGHDRLDARLTSINGDQLESFVRNPSISFSNCPCSLR